MYRRKELFIIILVQITVTLAMSIAEPNKGITHPGKLNSTAFIITDHPTR
jgi:hypothetical protein